MATPPESVMQSHFHTHEYGSCVKEQPPSEWGSIGVYNLPSQRLVGGNSPVSKCRDIAFVILFLGTLVAILAVGAYAIDTGGLHSIFSSPSSSNSSSPIDVSEQHLLIGLSVGFFCFLVTLCVLTIWIIRRWAFGFIIFAVVVTISLFFAFTLWAFYLERWMIGFFLVLLDILLLWSYWICRSFIPFIALVLKIASRSLLLFFGCIILCVFSAIFEGLWLVMIVFFAIASFNNHAITSSSANQSINMSLIGELIFLAFGCFWGLQVIRNVAHVAVSGSFATFYFAVNEGNRGAPSFTTLSALRRTVSTSFGSICFGSLFVAIIQFIRFLVNLFLGSTDNSCFKCFLSCCCNCLLSVIETIMSYFNRFAFCYVAIYGTSFLKSGKSTWRLFKERGFDYIISDNYIIIALMIISFMLSLITGFLAGASLWLSHEEHALAFGVAVFFASLLFSDAIFCGLDSCVCCLYVCFAEDPLALKETKPRVFENLVDAWADRYGDHTVTTLRVYCEESASVLRPNESPIKNKRGNLITAHVM